ncbi:MAG: GNAT family N-acetyltransferase [bacterium]|nr:GNAT family N-acetyltransferase [bacterium]
MTDPNDVFIGSVRLAPIDQENRSARFAIGIFDPSRFGQGLGTEATRLAVQFGFNRLRLHRISPTVLAGNARTIATYRRCGFVEEGRSRDTVWRRGAWDDDLQMAILAHQRADFGGLDGER